MAHPLAAGHALPAMAIRRDVIRKRLSAENRP